MDLSIWDPYTAANLRRAAATLQLAHRLECRRRWAGESLVLARLLEVMVLAERFRTMNFGTAVSLMALRHPYQIAAEARSLAELTHGRFSLGLGVSERAFVFGTLGMTYAAPSEYASEYVTIVRRLVAGHRVDFEGRHFQVRGRLPCVAGINPPNVLLGAVSSPMARVAGATSDGCITIFAAPSYIEEVIMPALVAGAESAERPTPPLIAITPCVATHDFALASEVSRLAFDAHRQRPHYRRVFARSRDHGEPPLSPLVWGGVPEFEAAFTAYLNAGVNELAVAAYTAGMPIGASLIEDTLTTAALAASRLK